MKKKLLVILMTVIFTISLVGCGNNVEQSAQDTTDKVAENTTEDNTANEIPDTTIDDESENTESDIKEETQVVIDNSDILVEYRGITEFSSDSWIVNLYIENRSGKELYVDADDVLINNYNVRLANNNESIPAGSKFLAQPNFKYIIDTNELAEYGIEKMTDINFTLKVKEEWSGDSIYEENVFSSLSKTVPGSTGETVISNGQVLIDNEDVTVSYCGISKFSDSSYIINLYMENKSDTEKYIDTDDILINGYSMRIANTNYAVPAHCKFLASPMFKFIIDVEDLETYGISNIETIDFTLNIKNEWSGDSLYSTPVNLTF